MNILNDIKTIIKNKQIKIKSNTDLNTNIADLNIDSIDFIDIIIDIEEKYNIQIEDEKLTNIKSINDLIKAIEEKL